MTVVLPVAQQTALMTNWGAEQSWRTEGRIGLFGYEDTDKAYFYGEWLGADYTGQQYDTGNHSQVLLFRMGSSEYAGW